MPICRLRPPGAVAVGRSRGRAVGEQSCHSGRHGPARCCRGDGTGGCRHWRVILGRLEATFSTGTFARGLVLVDRIGELAEDVGHHPDVTPRYPSVRVAVDSHDVGGLTDRDVDIAAQISAAVDELGIDADRGTLQTTEIAIDALDIPAVRPFWRAVLGYVVEGEDLVDPAGVGPRVWFQQMVAPRPQRNRIHLDVNVSHTDAQARVAAAVAAGGHLVSETRAPAFWVLADPEGNEACVCTWQNRD